MPCATVARVRYEKKYAGHLLEQTSVGAALRLLPEGRRRDQALAEARHAVHSLSSPVAAVHTCHRLGEGSYVPCLGSGRTASAARRGR